ncbi:60S ribosomal protein L21-like [Pteropus alecto]|uniref:60S ribosomal protein L21-like n=1 Tax=Pteropus alecto TaxID=9402 RepID=UPI000768632C|nr:60S ribosomal protein L21-like [Pteropus alecto]
MFPGPFRKHGAGHVHKGHQTGGTAEEGNGHCSVHQSSQDKTRSHPACRWPVVNKQIKGEVLVKRIKVCIERSKFSKSPESSLKPVKENGHKRRMPQRKVWAQLKRQPAPPGEALSERHGKDAFPVSPYCDG